MQKIIGLFTILAVIVVFSGCQGSKSSPEGAVESYLNALVKKDEPTLTALTCGDWEEQALLEYDSFSSVTTSLEGLSCKSLDQGDNQTSVSCSGKIQATYGNEVRQFDLQNRVYTVVNQNGNWLVCGYQRK